MDTANHLKPFPAAPRKTLFPASIVFLATLFITTASTTVLGLTRILPRPAQTQPIAFNHSKHTKDLELACTTCHVTVESEAFSGIPGADVCLACHETAQGDSSEEKKLVALLKAGEPLSWQPLFRQPPHVFYSHRRHVTTAKIACERCHGAIGASTTPPTRVNKLDMADCLDCHRLQGGPTDCTGCHR